MPQGRDASIKKPNQQRPEMRSRTTSDRYERETRRPRRSVGDQVDGYEDDFGDPRGRSGQFSPEGRTSRVVLEEACTSLRGVLQTGMKIASPSSNDIRNISDCKSHVRELRMEFRTRFKMIMETAAITARGPSGHLDEVEHNLAELDSEYGNVERYLFRAMASLAGTEDLVKNADRALVRIGKTKPPGHAKYDDYNGEEYDHPGQGYDQNPRRLREKIGRSPTCEHSKRNGPGNRKDGRGVRDRKERQMPLRSRVEDCVEDPDRRSSYDREQAEEYEEHIEQSHDQGQEPSAADQGETVGVGTQTPFQSNYC